MHERKIEMKSKIIPLVLLVVVASFLMIGCASAAKPASPEATPTVAPVADSTGVSAEGHVVPREKVLLSFASGGHVAKILVEKGDQVKAGQILAELDTTPLQQIAVDQAQRRIQELTSAASIAAAEQAVANNRDKFDEAQDDADSLYYPRASETLIKNTQGEIDLAKKALTRAKDNYRLVAKLEDGNERKAAALVTMTDAQLYLDNLIKKYNWYTGQPDSIDAGIIQSNFDAAKANLQEAEWYLSALKGAQVPENATGAQLAQLKQAREDLTLAQKKLYDTRLTASFSGTVTDVNVSLGQFVGPETWAVQLADFSQWYVETSDLTEVDVVNVTDGQPVTVSLDSLPDVELNGSVVSIAQNFAERQGDIVYQVKILLADQNPAIRWGMTAQVNFQP
jgi:HlyD family secretion protein